MNKLVIFKIALSLLFVVSFALTADAQMCGRYQVSVQVADENNQPINDAAVEILPLTKDETLGKKFVRDEKDSSKFAVGFLEGQNFDELHRLIVSANGYKTAETKFRFYSCSGLQMLVNLPAANSSALPVWNPKNQVFLATSDENRRMIKGVKVSIIKDGKLIKTVKSKIGGGGLVLDYGKYVFRFEKKGFQTEEIEVDAEAIIPTISVEPTLKFAK